MSERFDAVVVGSGFGGSVVAHKLAEAGESVLVLERGQPYPPGSFARTPYDWARNFWDPRAGLYGLFEVFSFARLGSLVSSGLGGGSLIYANVMLRKDEATFVQEDLAGGGYEHWPVTRAELDPHYDRVEAMQRPRRYPVEHEPYASTPKTRAMERAAAQLRLRFERPPLAVAFSANGGAPAPGEPIHEEEPNLHGRTRLTCTLSGECDVGCNVGAKHTLDFTYLSAAKRAGAQIRTCCEAHSIAPLTGRDGGYSVRYRQHLAAREGHDPALLDATGERERNVSAKRVVLAGGTFGSTALLLRNRAGLPGLSRALGTRFCGNGDMIYWARKCEEVGADGRSRPRYLRSSLGPVITATVQVPDAESHSGRGYWVQDAGGPAFSDWLWHLQDVPGDLWRMRGTVARRLVGQLRRRRDTNLSAELSRGLGRTQASAAMLPLLGMGRDIPDGRMRLRGETLEVDWTMDASREYFDTLLETIRRLSRTLGSTARSDRLARLSRLVTNHPLGGCPMGVDDRHGVVNEWGEVFGYPGLYVSDGSVMPGPVGANPSMTIAALADRFADGMLERRPAAVA